MGMHIPQNVQIAIAAVAGAAIVTLVVWLLWRLYRYVSEGRSVYTGAIDPLRARFLYAAFGLSVQHLRALHCDGRHFHLGGGERPLREVTAIASSRPKEVRISNAKAPHSERWRYERRDGKPDGRYTRNPKTMHATRYTLRFTGSAPGRLDLYDNGSLAQANGDATFDEMIKPLWSLFGSERIAALPAVSSVEDMVARCNRLLRLAQTNDLDALAEAYAVAERGLAAKQQEYYAALARKGQVDSAAEAAARRVSAGGARAARELYDRAQADQQALAAELDRLSADLAAARSAWICAIQEVRDLDALQAYRDAG